MTVDCCCLCCGKNIKNEGDIFELFYVNDVICHSCFGKLNYHPKHIKLDSVKVYSLYVYHGLSREMILQYKEYFDLALYPLFLYRHINKLKKMYKGYYVVCVPSSKEKISQRGFDHVKEMFSLLDLPFIDVFEKTKDISQKELSYYQRKNIGKYIKVKNEEKLKNKKILLVDDVLTTGETIKNCYRLIAQKCEKISVLIYCYSDRYLSIYEKKIIRH